MNKKLLFNNSEIMDRLNLEYEYCNCMILANSNMNFIKNVVMYSRKWQFLCKKVSYEKKYPNFMVDIISDLNKNLLMICLIYINDSPKILKKSDVFCMSIDNVHCKIENSADLSENQKNAAFTF